MKSLACAVLTVSDTRTAADDTSGDLLAELLESAGHRLAGRAIEKDDVYRIRARVSAWIADPEITVVLTTGGTGFTGRDCTPEALIPLFDKTIEGFGELFRQLSYDEIGSSTVQSRAVGGLANGTLIFALPGSNNAVRTGWEKIIEKQLDIDNRPCNFAELIRVSRKRGKSGLARIRHKLPAADADALATKVGDGCGLGGELSRRRNI